MNDRKDWRQRFRAIWHVDGEHSIDANHLVRPTCLHAYEERTGTTIFLRRAELLKLRAAPFDCGPNSLIVCYMAVAEASCFLTLGWKCPDNVLDLYVTEVAATNGDPLAWPLERDRKGKERRRRSLLNALRRHGLEGISTAQKDHWRQLILDRPDCDFTATEWAGIEAYNATDTKATCDLLAATWRTIDIDQALFWGQYMCAIACAERVGLPIDPYFHEMFEVWDRIKLHYIRQWDDFGLYDDGGHFVEGRLWCLIEERGWDWPRTSTGRYQLKSETIGRQSRRYPELRSLAKLRDQIAELRIGDLANSIGTDGYARIALRPFSTRMGRNQPRDEGKIYLPALPAWLRGLLKPPPGWGLFELDFRAQEVGFMAAFANDPAMIADYVAEPYLSFAKRAGLLPDGASADVTAQVREIAKPCVLGQMYGMTYIGLARKTKKSQMWARDTIARFHSMYALFVRWQGDTVAQAKFDRRIRSPYGWSMQVNGTTKHRTLMDWPAQAAGGDALRLTMVAAMKAGITVCGPVHDAVWVLAPLDALDATLATMRDIMRRAGLAVTGGRLEIGTKLEACVRYPNSYGDVRKPHETGQAMWLEIQELVSRLRQQKGLK